MKLMGPMGMNLSTDDLTVAWTTPVVGTASSASSSPSLAAYLPARRAGKVSPMAALRDAGTPADAKAGRDPGRRSALVLTGAGGAARCYLAAAGRQGRARARCGSAWAWCSP